MFKSIASNTLAQLVAKFFGAGLTFIITALIIRLSGVDLFGDLTKSLVLIAIGFTIVDFGLNALTVRNFGKGQNLAEGFTTLLFTRLLLSFFLVLLLNILVQFLPGGYTPKIKSVFWLGSLAIVFQGIFTSCNAVFQFQQNYWRSTIATILGTSLSAGLTYYYLLTSPTLAHFLLANSLGYLLLGISALLLLPLSNLKASKPWKHRQITSLLHASLPLGAILLASIAASKFDTIILGIFRSSSEVGQYGFAYRIFDVILVLPVFIMNAVYPNLVKATVEKSRHLITQLTRLMLVFGLISSLGAYFLAPLILQIRPGLELSVTLLRLLLLSLPIFFLTAPLMWSLISRHQEKTVLKIYLAAAIINGTLNLLLTPSFGPHSSAIITGVTELFIFFALLYFSKNI